MRKELRIFPCVFGKFVIAQKSSFLKLRSVKFLPFIFFVSALCVPSQTLFADAIKIDPVLNGESQIGREWLEPDIVRQDLERQISEALPTPDPKSVDAFLKTREHRLLLARWYFLHSVGSEAIIENLKKLTDRRIIFQFMSDPAWIEGYLYTAEPQNADKFLEFLLAIAKKDPEMPKDAMLRKIATATAGEYSRNDWRRDEPKYAVQRYEFFRDSWRDGKLNTLFDDLLYWDMRVVCGWKGNNDFGNYESLVWARDNVKLSESGYGGGEIHQLYYRLWNKAGDSIHGSNYYEPFRKYFTRGGKNVNMQAMAYQIGAVCGGISHYGATGAVANGIPGLTMGEPGHCAFATRVNGVWRSNNSISFRRGLHWTLLGERTWAFLPLMQELFENVPTTTQSFRKAALAKFFDLRKNRKAAASLYAQALATQPLNYIVWRDYSGYAKAQNAKVGTWMKMHGKIIETFAKKYPDVCATALQKLVYPTLLPLVKTDAEKIALFGKFFTEVETQGPASWAMEDFWDFQCGKISAGAKGKFVETGKSAFKGKKDYEKIFSDWASGNPRKKE